MGWAATGRTEFRIYDPTGRVKTEVTLGGVVRSSAHAYRLGGQGQLEFQLTSGGVSAFKALTRSLAIRGARVHALQAMAIQVNGQVVSRVRVDYRAYPDGMSGSQGIYLFVSSFATAQRLAAAIHTG
jgi:hypothetical protein